MTYYIEEKCKLEDGLLGGLEIPVELMNISLTADAFEPELRKQNIWLTSRGDNK